MHLSIFESKLNLGKNNYSGYAYSVLMPPNEPFFELVTLQCEQNHTNIVIDIIETYKIKVYPSLRIEGLSGHMKCLAHLNDEIVSKFT